MPAYVVVAKNFAEQPVFARLVYAKDRNDAVGVALFDENRERGYKKQLMRSKLYYSIRTVAERVPELDDPVVLEGNLSELSEEMCG